ncbi:MarR family transcriptional regulator [Lacticaseibacillus zeae]|uniref:MarR family transcriptional regulator n=1 Tax=Lacticaseibacillus zeae TaxID=57037 RepID=A0A5R8LGU0_LACZE|nr:MarR family transcriptional regulator [Lacticaseibacillus zeae]TLF35890.1 MarR family transcriptional regulator [Lacticaseibacillus zeae]
MPNDIGPLIKALNTEIQKEINNRLSKSSPERPALTSAQAELLLYLLHHHYQIVFQSDLESVFNLSRPTINGLVKRLKEAGMVAVEPTPTDKRYKQVVMTAAARKAMIAHQPEFRAEVQALEHVMTQGMTTDEVATVHRLLQLMLQNLKHDALK